MTKHLTVLGLAVTLTSCAALGPRDPGVEVEPGEEVSSTATSRGTGTQPAVTALPPVDTVDPAITEMEERQAIIDELNREGARPRVEGYREVAPTPGQIPANDVVELNYEQAELRDVLAELADVLDVSIIIDPSIADRVSIRTAAERPLAHSDIWPLMRLLTRQAGISLERVGNVYYARRSDSRLPMEISTPDRTGDSTAAVIMQITPLTYITVGAALEMLTPLVEPEGRITRIANSNTLAITAGASQLNRINELLSLIDDDPFSNQGIQLYQLSSASAADVAAELNDVLSMIEGNSPAYQVQALERINSILVTAPAARGFSEISRWVRLLDADRQEQAQQLFQYRVKNLNATELALTLTEVFRGDERARDADRERDRDEPRSFREQQQRLQEEAAQQMFDDQGEPVPAPQIAQTPGGVIAQVAVSADLNVTIVADDATNSLLIRSSPRDYRQLLATINQLDTVPLQVMINAAIAQVTLTDDSAFGVDWSRVAETASGSTRISTNFLGARGTNGDDLVRGLLFTRSFLDGAARIEATLEAIAVNNEVRLLARPSLTVVNNMDGLIRIGAEVPVRMGETATNVGTTENIQYRPTGIELTITPRINADGVVNLTLRQELSSLSDASGVSDNPIFENQEIETTVVVRDGENVILGGLIQDNNSALNTGVPFLNQVPIVGRLFSFQRDNNQRRELFIVLRPEIVDLNDQNSARYREILRRFERAAEMIDDEWR